MQLYAVYCLFYYIGNCDSENHLNKNNTFEKQIQTFEIKVLTGDNIVIIINLSLKTKNKLLK